MAFQTKEKKEITHRGIVFQTIQDLGKKASVEYKSNLKKEVDLGNRIQIIELADSRKEFIQLTEFLSDLLFSEFDSDMKKSYEEIIKEVKKNLEEFNKKDSTNENDKIEYANDKLELMRELFRELMCFLKRKDYLKEDSYVEDDEVEE